MSLRGRGTRPSPNRQLRDDLEVAYFHCGLKDKSYPHPRALQCSASTGARGESVRVGVERDSA